MPPDESPSADAVEEAIDRMVLRISRLVVGEVIQALTQEREHLTIRLRSDDPPDKPAGKLEEAVDCLEAVAPAAAPAAPIVAPKRAPAGKGEPLKRAEATKAWKAMVPPPPKIPPPWVRPARNPLNPAIQDRFGRVGEIQAPMRSVDDIAAATADQLTKLLAGLIAKAVEHFRAPPQSEPRPGMSPEMAMRMEPTAR